MFKHSNPTHIQLGPCTPDNSMPQNATLPSKICTHVQMMHTLNLAHRHLLSTYHNMHGCMPPYAHIYAFFFADTQRSGHHFTPYSTSGTSEDYTIPRSQQRHKLVSICNVGKRFTVEYPPVREHYIGVHPGPSR